MSEARLIRHIYHLQQTLQTVRDYIQQDLYEARENGGDILRCEEILRHIDVALHELQMEEWRPER